MQHPELTGPSHLSDERLAAFDDESYTADEQAHLAACAACRAEQQAYVALLSMAAEEGRRDLDADAPRLVSWEAIADGLRQPAPLPTPAPRAARARWVVAPLLKRAAAAVVLVGGGALLGRMSGEVSAARALGTNVAVASPVTAGTMAQPVSFSDPLAADGFATIDQATAVLARAQRDYERASLWLAANDTTARDSDVYRARLAALDQMMEASRAALRDAPQDPVLNHYYLAAYTAREATLQQLGGALPVDKTIERY